MVTWTGARSAGLWSAATDTRVLSKQPTMPVISADGAWVAYVDEANAEKMARFSVARVVADGSAPRTPFPPMYVDPIVGSYFAATTDGELIVARAQSAVAPHVLSVYDPVANRSRDLADGIGLRLAIDLVNRRVAFESARELWVMSLDGGDPIARVVTDAYEILLRPDGALIWRDATLRLYRFDVDRAGAPTLLVDSCHQPRASWDGTLVVCDESNDADKNRRVRIVSVDGGVRTVELAAPIQPRVSDEDDFTFDSGWALVPTRAGDDAALEAIGVGKNAGRTRRTIARPVYGVRALGGAWIGWIETNASERPAWLRLANLDSDDGEEPYSVSSFVKPGELAVDAGRLVYTTSRYDGPGLYVAEPPEMR